MATEASARSLSPSERFGENLLRVRQARKMSQEVLAERAEIHRTQISLLESGRRQPLMETLLRLAGALEVSGDTLLEGVAWEPADVGTGRWLVENPPELPRVSP
jgi:transcriptional regulator with XRE-family HTH domain